MRIKRLQSAGIIFVSLILSVGGAEFFLREIYEIQPFSEMKLRYHIDGVPSFAPGFYEKSLEYPIENKKNINVQYEEKYAYPLEITIQTDQNGYRNNSFNEKNIKTLLVGDSVVFGYGAPNNETLSHFIDESDTVDDVYSIGVSGWGPASYMKSINSILEKTKPENIIIVFFLGNDDSNLIQSCWEEIKINQPPKSRIYRNDIPSYSVYAPPNYLLTSSLLRRSSIVRLSYDVLLESEFNSSVSVDERREPHRVDQQDFQINTSKLIRSLSILKMGYCVNKENQYDIDRAIAKIQNGNIHDADLISYSVSKNLAKRKCAPIVEGDAFGRGDTKRMNYNFVTRNNFLPFLPGGDVEPAPADYCEIEEGLTMIKRNIFREWLSAISEKYNLDVFLLPAEYNIFSDHKNHWLCTKDYLTRYGCHNLSSEIRDHYVNSNDALYLDGSHLNQLGAEFVSSLIKQKVWQSQSLNATAGRD